jgi:urocanate hydratase
MSGAQAKAAVVCGCVGVIAEVSYEALKKRYDQGWVCEMIEDVEELMRRIREARKKRESTSIGFHGNAVTLWERLYKEYKETGELLVDLGSDQTSCHDPFGGGYYPVQLNFEEANKASKHIYLFRITLKKFVNGIYGLENCIEIWQFHNSQRCSSNLECIKYSWYGTKMHPILHI